MAPTIQKPKSLIEPLVKVAAALGIIQGFGWTLWSLVAVLIHSASITITTSDELVNYIYEIYLADIPTTADIIIIGPKEYNYFMYLYLILSFCWLVTSCVLLWAIVKGKKNKYYEVSIGIWTVTASLLSLLDLILFFLLIHDHSKLSNNAPVPLALVAVGIIMTVAMRGFVLWIVNIIFLVILGKHWYKKHNQGVADDQPSAIDAYSTGLPPWQVYNEPTSSNFDNKGFRDDNDNAAFPPSARQYPFMDDRNNYNNNNSRGKEVNNPNSREFPQVNLKRPENRNDNYWNNGNQNREGYGPPSRPYSEQDSPSPYGQPAPLKTAKIGRPWGQRSPPLNVPSPYIPAPDYSPPGSPKVRGVLRPKSNYMY